MVANPRFISTVSPTLIADYYLRETEPQQQRDMDAEFMLQQWYEREGTRPEVRLDLPPMVGEMLALTNATPSRKQISNLVNSKTADGDRLRRMINPTYQRQDGTWCRTTDFVDVTLSTDKSWALALANSATAANRAMLIGVVQAAGEDTMRQFEQVAGWTRRGRGGAIHEQGEIGWIRFTHHTARQTEDALASPDLHMHFIVPNATVTESGYVGALNLRRVHGQVHMLGAHFNQRLALGAAERGIEIKREAKWGFAQIATVPEHVREAFSHRKQQAAAHAKRLVRDRGLVWDELSEAHQKRLIDQGAKHTRHNNRRDGDGIADRPAWQAKMFAMGFKPVDVARPHLGQPEPRPVNLTLMQRVQRLRESTLQAWQMAKQQVQEAELGMRLRPSLTRAADVLKAMVPELTRRVRQLQQRVTDLPARAKAVGELLKRRGQERALVASNVMEVVHKMADTRQAKLAQELDAMAYVAAWKVYTGKIQMSEAVDYFTNREERAVTPTGYNPVHHTYQYEKGAPGPENRLQREAAWTDRLGGMVMRLESGKQIGQQNAPAVKQERGMRMER